MTVEKLKVQLQNNYSLYVFVAERIHFPYKMHTSGGNKKAVLLEEDSDINEDF